MKQNILVTFGVVLVATVVGGFLVGLVGNSTSYGAGTRFPNGLSTDSTSPTTGQVRTTTITVTGAATFSSTASFAGLITANAGTLKSSTNSTSTTATSQELVLADINGYDNIIITPNTADITLTTFASSTASAWLPADGDGQDTCIYNATTTAGIDITMAAGTGFDYEVATSSDNAFGSVGKIGPQERACFSFMRQPASTTPSTTLSDITMDAVYYVNAD